LTNVTLSNTVKVIGFGAFMDCIQLHHIQLPYHLKRLEASMFANCPQLTNITCVQDHNNYDKTMRNESTTATVTSILSEVSSTSSSSNNQHRSLLDDDDDDDEEEEEEEEDDQDERDIDNGRNFDSIQLPPKLLSIGTFVPSFFKNLFDWFKTYLSSVHVPSHTTTTTTYVCRR
jgi:BspA type Leucine rich repeat region (6 copies)